MVSECIYFVGCRTVEQLSPDSRGIILIQVKNSAPCRMFEMPVQTIIAMPLGRAGLELWLEHCTSGGVTKHASETRKC